MLTYTLPRTIPRLFALLAGLTIPSAGLASNFDTARNYDFSVATTGQELGCLAMNIYQEARGESSEGQAAVAAVTMNRVRSERYPDSVCEVVWQPKQFSWTRNSPRYLVIKDSKAWEKALVIAERFINGARLAEIGNATNFHSVNVRPAWSDSSRLIAQVGKHYFYAL